MLRCFAFGEASKHGPWQATLRGSLRSHLMVREELNALEP
jgi:hypothetical protein